MAKETYYMEKETYYMAKMTYHMAKETYYMVKETYCIGKRDLLHRGVGTGVQLGPFLCYTYRCASSV